MRPRCGLAHGTRARPLDAAFSVIELLFVLGLVTTLSAIAVPHVLTLLDDMRTLGAVRYLSTRLQDTRMESLARTDDTAMRFTRSGSTYAVAVYVDENHNGVRTRDIESGIDRLIQPAVRLSDLFPGVDFGALPGLPAVDTSSAPPGSDPIRLGSSDMVTFTPLGTATSGSLYVRGRRNAQYVIRVFGETGKTRILKFSPEKYAWTPL